MNESQRGMVAASIANIEPNNLGNSQKIGEPGSIDPGVVKQSEAAQMLNVSLPTVKRAAVVKQHGAQELQAAVSRGAVAVAAAAAVDGLIVDIAIS